MRNRRRVLEAAQRLFERDGVACTSMDAIAAEAGVGKGTLFRRFGDRASLARAVLEQEEIAFQDEMIRGAPPLGPGVPAADRLVAFVEGRLDLLERHGDLLAAAEASNGEGGYLRSAVWAFYHAHVTLLAREAAPDVDARFVAETVLTALNAELFLHQRRDRGVMLAELKRDWAALVRRLAGDA